jgi:hypothetical protein
MITLKKSFELQNYMKNLLHLALASLGLTENITTTTQEHMRTKAFYGGEDETITKPKHPDFTHEVMDVVDFACDIQREMDLLTIAINNAKHSHEKDFDSMIAINNRKRALLTRLEIMSSIKPTETIKSGQAWKFNEEGNQVAYSYDIKEVTTIDFDRNVIKSIISRIRKELDEYSVAIDEMQLETMVDFNTIYEIGDSLEDAIEKFIEHKQN